MTDLKKTIRGIEPGLTPWKKAGETLADCLDKRVFADAKSTTMMAETSDIAGFAAYPDRYKKALPMKRKAVEVL